MAATRRVPSGLKQTSQTTAAFGVGADNLKKKKWMKMVFELFSASNVERMNLPRFHRRKKRKKEEWLWNNLSMVSFTDPSRGSVLVSDHETTDLTRIDYMNGKQLVS